MSHASEATGGPAEPAPPSSSPPPAEPVQPDSSPPLAKDASTTSVTGDGGGDGKGRDGKGGNGEGDDGASPIIKRLVTNLAPLLLFTLVALAFVFILVSIFWPYFGATPKSLDKTLLQLLADTETARGLITFLVAVGTVAIAVILVVYLASSEAKPEVVKDRFAFSKEILTSLIGILGTIIGFYFGTTQDQTRGHSTPATLTLANLSITPSKPVQGNKVTLNVTLSGGEPPYSYVIRFSPDKIKEITGDSPNGTISQAIIDAYDPTMPLDITFEGKDATGAISGNRVHLETTP